MKFRHQDIVKFIENGELLYGEFCSYDKNAKVCHIVTGVARELHLVALSDVFSVKPVCPSIEDLKKFVRFETTEKQFFGGEGLAKILRENFYFVTFDDLLTALENMKKSQNAKRIMHYFYIVNVYLEYMLLFGDEMDYEEKIQGGLAVTTPVMEPIPIVKKPYEFDVKGLLSDREALHKAFSYMEEELGKMFGPHPIKKEDRDFSHIMEFVEHLANNYGKLFVDRTYTDTEKYNFLAYYHFNQRDQLEHADKEVQDIFKSFAEDLCEQGIEEAMSAVAYGCYGGNCMWPCDYEKSEKILLKLMEISKDNRYYANTLGYIYYYGRVNHGNSEYEKAYQYFSLAAFGEVYEAQYKIADMYELGLGVNKNLAIAKQIVTKLYWENIKFMYLGAFDSKFADIAFRMCRIAHKNKQYRAALYYILQAQYAIKERRKQSNYIGDKNVAEAIAKVLDECKTAYATRRKKQQSSHLEYLFPNFKDEKSLARATLSEVDNHTVTVTVTLEKKQHGQLERMLLTLPELGYCGLTDKIVFKAKWVAPDFKPQKIVLFDDIEGNAFTLHGNPVFEIDAIYFELVLPKGSIQKPHRFISVIFNENSRPYDYLCDCPDVQVGDKIRIDAPSGECVVKVIKIFEKTQDELSLPVSRYKKISKIVKV